MDSKLKGYFFVSLCGALSGFIIFGGQIFSNLGLSLFEISIVPYAFTILWVLPFVLKKGFAFPKQGRLLLLFYGIIAALTVLTQFGGVVFGASVAVVVLLLYSQPLWTTLISKFFLKEKVSIYQWIACFLVLAGVFLLVNPANLFTSSSWLGVLSALTAGIFLSLWVVVGRQVSKTGLPPTTIFLFEEILSVIICLVAYPIILFFTSSPEVVSLSLVHPLNVWLLLVGFSLFITTASHLSYLFGSKFISATNSGILMLLEPVVGVLLAIVFLSQPLSIPIIFGGVMILLGNILVITKG